MVKSIKLIPRHVLGNLREALSDTPAVLIHGPRQSGKTTLAEMLGDEYVYFSFDNKDILNAAQEDPTGFVERLPDHVILDEVQRIPELFSTIKYFIDKNRKPGRFVLTGSTNIMLLPTLSDSLAGRIEIIRLFPLTQAEIMKNNPSFLDRIFSGSFKNHKRKRLSDSLINIVLKGGYPEALVRKTHRRRKAWYNNYINTIILRDIKDIAQIKSAEDIPQIFHRLTNTSSQILNVNNIASDFQLDRKTMKSYIDLLQRMFLVEYLRPWFGNRNKRLIKSPKLHVSDTGLMGAFLNLTKANMRNHPELFGQIVESFIYNEIRRLTGWHSEHFEFFYYRDKDQYEVDILIENSAGEIAGVEVKRGATIGKSDFKGLKKVKRQLGEKFVQGVILYDGEFVLPFGEKLIAAPISVLWEG